MINCDTLEQINTLCKIYKQKWGKEVDYTVFP